MSLIHEALEKVEQEKKDTFLPQAVILKVREKVQARENLQMIYGIAVALVFCFILGMTYLFIGSGPQERSSETPTTILPQPDQERFVLTGITRVGADGTAIINNELVRVGDGVSGAQVTRIEEREVTLDEKGKTITLEL